MDKPRIVADTNVLVSGLLWTGVPHKIIKLAEDKKIILLSSLPLIEEISGVLERDKFDLRLEKLNSTRTEIIGSLLSIIEIVHPAETISIIKEDPDDNIVLECATAAAADFIVSGDPHLLKLKNFNEIKITAPHNFLKII